MELPHLESLCHCHSNAVAAQYEMPFLHNAKGTSDGVYDVPSEVGEPCGYEVLTSSTLPSSYEAVSGEWAENDEGLLQANPQCKMSWHGDGTLHNPNATPAGDPVSDHEYQEAEIVPKSTRPMLEVSQLTIGHVTHSTHTHTHSHNISLYTTYAMFSHCHHSYTTVCLVVHTT